MKHTHSSISLFVRLGSLLLVGAFAVGAARPTMAWAEEEVFCAQVIPCDARGKLLPEFSDPTGGCFSFYSRQCEKAAQFLPLLPLSCDGLQQAMEKLQVQVAALKRRAREKARIRITRFQRTQN